MSKLTRQHFQMFAERLASMWFSTTQLDWEKNVDCVIKLCKYSNPKFDETKFKSAIQIKLEEMFKDKKVNVSSKTKETNHESMGL